VSWPVVSEARDAVPPEVAVLAPFVQAGVFGPFEVQLATTMVRLQPGVSDEVVLALAVAARAPRFGHVCAELGDVDRQIVESDESVDTLRALPWPSLDTWTRALGRSALVAAPDAVVDERVRPLVWDGNRVYLHRYWHYESAVVDDLTRRARRGLQPPGPRSPEEGGDALEAGLDALFDSRHGGPDLQREAARRALTSSVSIIAGGPGTGKTHTVARLLAVAHRVAEADDRSLSVALAAPTGKAAQRMRDAVRGEVPALEQSGAISPAIGLSLARTDATTIHRLLGWLPGPRFEHDRRNPLPHHLVIVDETSMVSLPLMARLLDAVRPEARVVLVGDPFQLASIEAGTVLGDVVGPSGESDGNDVPAGSPLAGRVTVLRRMHRFGADSAIAALAEAIRVGDGDAAVDLVQGGHPDVRWVRDSDGAAVDRVRGLVIEAGVEMALAAMGGDVGAALAAANRIKVLAATRRGPLGLYDWSDRIEAAVGMQVPQMQRRRRWFVGRPIIVTGNDRVNRVANGDVGVVVDRNGGMEVGLSEEAGVRYLAPSRLDRVETWWAMTIHKSQGSEFTHAVVSLPQPESPILTRELLYTAVTRARKQLTIVGSEAALRAAVDRPVARASGLRDRLWPA
jgi:exodeoxyribonuclease V alpha subunit